MKLSLCKNRISKPENRISKLEIRISKLENWISKTEMRNSKKPEMRKSLIFPLKKSSQHSDIDYL